ncbi:MAG: sigma 54-interacting transcriptional regulator [Acidobacteria bacterium]|nr:sigma 54-interacting transcriptional regulator [Acidobacteriota bacterium]
MIAHGAAVAEGEGVGESTAASRGPGQTTGDASGRVPGVDELFGRGRYAAAERLLRREIGRLRRRRNFRGAGGVALDLGHQHLLRGRVTAALTDASEAEELCSAARWPCGVVAGQLLAGWSLLEDDRLAEAEATLRSALAGAVEHAHANCVRAATLSVATYLVADRRMGDAQAAMATLPADGREPWRHADAVAERPESDGLAARCTEPWEKPPRLLPRHHELLSAEIQIRLALAAGDPNLAADRLARACGVGAMACGTDRVSLSVCEVLVLGAQGRTSEASHACAAGLRAARTAHAPAMALELRLIYAQVLAEMGQLRDAARLVERLQESKWPAPSRLRRRLREVADRIGQARNGSPSVAGGPTVQVDAADVLAILQSCGEREDDHQIVSGVCQALRTSLHATAVAVFGGSARTTPLACVGSRSFTADIIRRTLTSRRPSDLADVAYSGEAAAPICSGNETLGVIVAKWPAPPGSLALRHLALLRSAASAVVPAVRGLAGDAPDLSRHAGVLAEIAGSSSAVIELRQSVVGAAAAPFPVLIQGESGSGKELVAKSIHGASDRRARRFCPVNCAALPDELCEAELFGHARGAFTGAATDRAGLFEDADGGTLFLDEISELSPRAQAKLLRVIQEGEVRRLGENSHRRVDPRIVAASNRSLQDEVDAGRFRHDLLFRLDVIRVRVPSLRERPEDIPCLVAQIWRTARERLASRAELSPATVDALTRYAWPGNVRELQNVLCALAAYAPRCGRVGPDRLPCHIKASRTSVAVAQTLEDGRREFERRFVRDALVRAGGRRTRAAEQLGVTRQGLAKLLARLEISAGPGVPDDGTSGP